MRKSTLLGLVSASSALLGSVPPSIAASDVQIPASCSAVNSNEKMSPDEIKACFAALMSMVDEAGNRTYVMPILAGTSGGGGGCVAGPKGETGIAGPQGTTGPAGPTGPTGPEGDIS